jgi:hypothetical protein
LNIVFPIAIGRVLNIDCLIAKAQQISNTQCSFDSYWESNIQVKIEKRNLNYSTMDHAYENYLNEGNLLLNRAEEELNKPQKDVMTVSVCQGTKMAIDSFLKAYLTKHQVTDVETGDLMSRFHQCVAFKPEFEEIDIHSFECIHDEKCSMSEYCMSIDKVSGCLKIAEDLRNLIYR